MGGNWIDARCISPAGAADWEGKDMISGRTNLADLVPDDFLKLKNRDLMRVLNVITYTLSDWRSNGVPDHQLDHVKTAVLLAANPLDMEVINFRKRVVPHSGMASLYKEGKTLQEIGDKHGVTRERARQVLKVLGVKKEDGGLSVRSIPKAFDEARKQARLIAKKKAAHESMFGCSDDEILRINGRQWSWSQRKNLKESPAAAYIQQKLNAEKIRGIQFLLTLPEWWRIWQESGHWEQRGPGKGYCMTRIGDTGPYEVGNVEIKTVSENFSEAYYKHPWHERFPNGGFKKKDADK